MDVNTWNKLTESEQTEVKLLSPEFIKQVKESNSSNGFDFLNKYEVRKINENYSIFEKALDSQFGDFKSKSKKVIEALITNVGQNYGR